MPRRFGDASGESLDLRLDVPEKNFQWTKNAESAAVIAEVEKIRRVEVRIPIASIAETAPASGASWRIDLFRQDRPEKAGLVLH